MSALPRAAVTRMPVYLRVLTQLAADGQDRVSSARMAETAGVSADVLRRDLSGLGQLGQRGVGYPVEILRQAISQALGLNRDQAVVLVGAGHLGTALAGYTGFAERGLRISAVVDADPALRGTGCGELTVQPLDQLAQVVDQTGSELAILAVPAAAAQPVVDQLVDAGIRGILNFASVKLTVPAGVSVRAVDLSAELQLLAFHNGTAGRP